MLSGFPKQRLATNLNDRSCKESFLSFTLQTGTISTCFVVLFQLSSTAGGGIWNVYVEQVLQASDRATVVLKPIDQGAFYQSCQKLSIHINYQSPRGSRRSEPQNLAYQEHLAALQLIHTHHKQKIPLRFGEMVGGLQEKNKEQPWWQTILSFLLNLFQPEELPLLDSNVSKKCQFTVPFGLSMIDEGRSLPKGVYIRNY
ncbi:hypothetical protein ACN4EG_15555 [Alkalinema pantanalense CENA528]|uniref:hypothetical protein n=1 Tax=Alkalinema pantanalense TaxID=1620705 RepID=UPI003D6F2FAB